MMARIALIILVALGGAALTMQMAWNGRLRVSTGSPVMATIISVMITLVSLAVVWFTGLMNRGSFSTLNSVPKWAWFGGVCAAYYLVISLIAIPKLGTAAVLSLVIAGQMVAALILDSLGAFGVPYISFSATRIVGTLLLLAGVILIQRQ